MKTLIFALLTFFAFTANAQTADANTTTNTQASVDMMISVPMIGNINVKDCDEKMQEELQPLSDMKVIKIDDAIYFYIDAEESILAEYIPEEKEIDLPIQ